MVMPAGGYFGQALVVDVTSGTSRTQPLPDSVLRGYIGGSGLGTWLLCQLGTAGADPLGSRSPLAFVFSPLVGTPLTTSAKFAVVAKSPLTNVAMTTWRGPKTGPDYVAQWRDAKSHR